MQRADVGREGADRGERCEIEDGRRGVVWIGGVTTCGRVGCVPKGVMVMGLVAAGPAALRG